MVCLKFTGVSVVHFMTPSNQQCCKISPFVNTLCTRYPSVNFLKVTSTIHGNPHHIWTTLTCHFALHSRSMWMTALLLHVLKMWGQFQHSKSTKMVWEWKRWSAPANSCWNTQWGIMGFRPWSRWFDVSFLLQLLWSKRRLSWSRTSEYWSSSWWAQAWKAKSDFPRHFPSRAPYISTHFSICSLPNLFI